MSHHNKKTRTGRPRSGFTIIEMLVVVLIIGILAGMVLSSMWSAKDRARYARARSEMDDIAKTIIVARDEKHKKLSVITGSVCTDCPCLNRDMKMLPDADACVAQYKNALAAIQNAAGSVGRGLENLDRDPWGSPYGMDENETETGPLDCRSDTLSSAGRDGILGTADDAVVNLPLFERCP